MNKPLRVNVWLYDGGLRGGRGVCIRTYKYGEEDDEIIKPIILEDWLELKELQKERGLTLDDVEPAINRFKKLTFKENRLNYVKTCNYSLMKFEENRVKIFEERLINYKEELTKIERDPTRKWNLEQDIEYNEKLLLNSLKTLEKLRKLEELQEFIE